MADGGRAGKVTGQQLAAEMQAKAAREAADFAAMGAHVTGHGAQTVCVLWFAAILCADSTTKPCCAVLPCLHANTLLALLVIQLACLMHEGCIAPVLAISHQTESPDTACMHSQ